MLSTLADYQLDLRRSYLRGGPAAVIAGLVWVASAVVYASSGMSFAFAVLLFGGMLIFPLSFLVGRFIFRLPKVAKGNPLARLIMETLPALMTGLFIAFLFLTRTPEFVYPICAIAVGVHYFPFRTAYGDVGYWLLGALLTGLGLAAVFGFAIAPFRVALIVAALEIGFGVGWIWRGLRERKGLLSQ